MGVAGVGKTSVVRGIAQRIAAGRRRDLPRRSHHRRDPVSELVAGTGVRGALALRLGSAAARKSPRRVAAWCCSSTRSTQLFSRRCRRGDRRASSSSLSRKASCPASVRPPREEYAKVIESDAALARRFTPRGGRRAEPRGRLFWCWTAVAEKLSAHHGVSYDDDALALAIAWSVRYLPGRALPDKAVGIADLGRRARAAARWPERDRGGGGRGRRGAGRHARRALARDGRRSHAEARGDPRRASGGARAGHSLASRASCGATPRASARSGRSARSSCSAHRRGQDRDRQGHRRGAVPLRDRDDPRGPLRVQRAALGCAPDRRAARLRRARGRAACSPKRFADGPIR